MQYSPKLKKAMEEVKKILHKHDLAALVVLHTPGFSEYLCHISPSYSCATLSGDELRVRAKAVDFGGDTRMRDRKITDTTNMLHLLSQVGMREALALADVSEQVDQITQSDHFGGGHSSHTEQNN